MGPEVCYAHVEGSALEVDLRPHCSGVSSQAGDQSYSGRLKSLFGHGDGEGAQAEGGESGQGDGEGLGERVRRFTFVHAKVLSALGLGVVIVTMWAVMSARTVVVDEPVAVPTWAEPTPTVEPEWLVHVVGAVANPGVVSVPAGARVLDALRAAGGLVDDADPAELNLAAVVCDGCQIIVGTRANPHGEVRTGSGGGGSGGTSGSSGTSATINLNTATAAQLETLPGVGPVTARNILAWRERNGRFTDVAQLQEVDGIGPKTYAQLAPLVSVS